MKLVAGGRGASSLCRWRTRKENAMPEDLTHIAGPFGAALLRGERRHRTPAGPPAPARPDHQGGSGVLKVCTLAESTQRDGFDNAIDLVRRIPIPDSAGFQQSRLAGIKPGERLLNEMVQTIVFAGDKPILATAAIGSSMIPETIKLVLSVAGQGLSLDEVQAAPAFLSDFSSLPKKNAAKPFGISIPEGTYHPEFIKDLKAKRVKLNLIPTATAKGLRGTAAAVKIDAKMGLRSTTETTDFLLFGGAQ